MEVVNAIKKGRGIVAVRTQCDRYESGVDSLTLEQEQDRDKAYLASLGMHGVPMFMTAARGTKAFDNAKLKALMEHGVVV